MAFPGKILKFLCRLFFVVLDSSIQLWGKFGLFSQIAHPKFTPCPTLTTKPYHSKVLSYLASWLQK